MDQTPTKEDRIDNQYLTLTKINKDRLMSFFEGMIHESKTFLLEGGMVTSVIVKKIV